MNKTSLFFLWMMVTAATGLAQENDSIQKDTARVIYEFVLKDGTRLVGQVLDQNIEFYTLRPLHFGTIQIATNQVVSMILQDEKVTRNRSSSYYENQFGIKYFFFPTAIAVERNKWYYTNQYLFFSNFTYGISKRVSAGLSFFTFVPTTFISPTVKITFNPENKIKFAVSAQYIYVRENTRANAGFVQAILTSGTAQNNFTVGIGGLVSNRGVNEGAVVTFGFVKKVSAKLTAISENNILIGRTSGDNSLGLLSAGLRFDRRTHAFDLGLLVPTSGLERNIYLIPYLGFNLRLTK